MTRYGDEGRAQEIRKIVEKKTERGHCGGHSFGNKDKTRFVSVEFVILSVY